MCWHFGMAGLTLLLTTMSAAAQTVPIAATASSEVFAALGAENAIDANAASFWSSAGHADADHTEWIEIELSEAALLTGVRLTPRLVDGAALSYPRDYTLEYSYDATGATWFPVAGGQFEDIALPTGVVTHDFTGEIIARRLRITATELTTDDFGNYYFQLAELDPLAADRPPPFTIVGDADLAAQLNMMWLIYGSISDGTDAVMDLGSEPAYHEWMALKYGWSQMTTDTFAKLRNDRVALWPLSNDGYAWSWSDRETWPGVPPVYHNENNAKLILAAWRIWTWTRDDAWFDHVDGDTVTSPALPPRPGMSDITEGMTLRAKLRLAMQYLEHELQGGLGGITIEDNGMNNDGTVTGDPTNYWDNWRMGYKNAYDNIYYYAALEAMAQLEDLWANCGRADQLRAYRDGCHAAYDAEFWDAATGRYICTIDKNGLAWDFGATFINVEALAYGLGDASKAADVFAWLDGDRIIPGETSTGADIYHWGFAPRSNTIAIESIGPPYWWADHGGQISVENSAAWPAHLENGGVIFYVSYYDVLARLRHLGPDAALTRLRAIVDEFEIDQLRRDPEVPGSPAWQLGIVGEFPESGLVPCVLVYGFGGIEPSAAGLHIAPALPSGWNALVIRGVNWAGVTLDITIEPDQVTIASTADSSRTIFNHRTPIEAGATQTFTFDPDGAVLLRTTPQGYGVLPDGRADRVTVRADQTGAYIWTADRTAPAGWGDQIADAWSVFGAAPQVPLLGDVNGDGFADRIVVGVQGGGLYWSVDYSRRDGSGFGDGVADTAQYFGGEDWTPVGVAPIDNDLYADRAVIAPDVNGLPWFWDHNAYPADLGDAVSDHLNHAFHGAATAAPIGLADVNGDGHADRVINATPAAAPTWNVNLTHPAAGNGVGTTLGDWGGASADSGVFGAPGDKVLLGDVDGDGRADRVIVRGTPQVAWAADLTDSLGSGDVWGDGVVEAAFADNDFGDPHDTFLLGDILSIKPACASPAFDVDEDGDVDIVDFVTFSACYRGGMQAYPSQPSACVCLDHDGDDDIDALDLEAFLDCLLGVNCP